MSFFKLVMNVLLKIYAPGKMFGKICLKSRRDRGPQFLVRVISQKRGNRKLLVLLADLPQLLPLVWRLNLPIRKNDYKKNEWEYFLSKQQIYSM